MHNGNWRIFIFRGFNGVSLMAVPIAAWILRSYLWKKRKDIIKLSAKNAAEYYAKKKFFDAAQNRFDETRWGSYKNNQSSRPSVSARNVRRGGKRSYSKPKVSRTKPAKIPRRGRRCPKGYRFNARLNACIRQKK